MCVPVSSLCEPQCGGKTCGSDGCGGSCGACNDGEVCSAAGQCIDASQCEPQCKSKMCGPDGCGGSCGSCSPGYVCNAQSLCDPEACVPYCSGRQCGPDGCGGSCGSCGADVTCNESTGQCMPHRVKGCILVETQTVYYDSVTLPKFGKKIDEPGAYLPIMLYDAAGTELASGETDADGCFEFPLNRLPYVSDWISILPVWRAKNQSGEESVKLAMFVADTVAKDTNDLWQWTVRLSDFAKTDDPGDVGNVRITTDMSSGALFIYMTLKRAYEDLATMSFGKTIAGLPSMGVIWKPGLVWKCGTCFLNQETQGLRVKKGSSYIQLEKTMEVGGSSKDESAWGYPTLLHEFGHYVLFQRKDDTKGGTHYLNAAADPKLAWSEGFATFYSLMAQSREENAPVSVYWRILSSGSFWVDYAKIYDASGAGSLIIPKPSPTHADGMKQNLGEGWVSHLLWAFYDGKEIPDVKTQKDNVALGEKGIFDGIGSVRYTKPITYNYDGEGKLRTVEGTDLVDFIDSAVCNAIAAGDDAIANDIMDLTIAKGFPYDRTPNCPASE